MSDLKKTKICDPLYNYIYLDEGEKSLMDHALFQRLRLIQQLGFSEKAFPSGTGNRFSHSLGVCHLAGEVFDSVFNKNKSLQLSQSKKQAFKKALRMAALLHDIGHGPLSHSSEALMPPIKSLGLEKFLDTDFKRQAFHEDYSVKLIMSKEGLYDCIQQAGVKPQIVAQLLHREFKGEKDFFTSAGLDFLPLLRQIISSDFDVDRIDYLYRDSLYCGVKYGLIDFVWLIFHFDCHIEKDQVFLAINKEALYNLESLILGRQHMRLIVYFHHKSVIYNYMLKKYAKEVQWKLPVDISDYVAWTDSRLFDKLKSDENKWARRIRDQKPYIRLYECLLSQSLSLKDKEVLKSLKEKLANQSIDFIDTNSEKHAIKPHKKTLRKEPIYLKNKNLNQAQDIYEDSPFLPLPSRQIERIYVEPDHFEKAKSFLNLGKN